jgi:serine protease Do
VNATGETLGIIDSIEGSEASILPAALIKRAAKRVLAQQASVPKPWLGVKGDPIVSVQLAQLQQQGWEMMRASDLAQAHRGILLTFIVPDSPAASASLKAGDVILKVNDEYVQSAEDFSWFLEQAGPSTSVEFTVAKPERKAEELVTVVLSGSPRRPAMTSPRPPASAKTRWLVAQGIETIALRAIVAARLGSTAGLLVVYVQPASPAFEAGLQPGDVIETIDGRPALAGIRPVASSSAAVAATFEIIREKQKLVIAVAKPAQIKQ